MRFKKTIPVIMLITSFMMVLSSAFSISAATIDTEINEVGASVSDNSSVGADTRKTHKYTANDITIVQKIILGQSVNLSQKNIIELYDIDDNKKITKADQELIQEHLNGKININTGDFTPQVPTTPIYEQTSVSLPVSSVTIGLNETFTIKPKAQSGALFSYISGNQQVASVNSSGLITPKKVGTANITVTARIAKKRSFSVGANIDDTEENESSVGASNSATFTVTVKKEAKALTLNKTALTLGIGEVFTLRGSVSSDSAAYGRAYKSSNAKIAEVDKNTGKVTAKSTGTATISCTLKNNVTAQCKVSVKQQAGTVSLNSSRVELKPGQQYDFVSSIPGGTAAYWRKYYSENTGIVTINEQTGKATAKATGTTRIYCVLSNGCKAYSTVIVKSATQPTTAKPTLSLDKSSLTVTVGQTATLKATTNQKSVTFTSSNTSIATVTSQGVVKGVKAGTATITCKAGNLTKTCTVTVKASTQPTTAKPTLNLDKTTLTVTVGKTATLKATTNQKSVTYTSSNTGIATVTNQGVVKGVKAGTATITCKAGNLTKTCTVTVKAATQPTTAKPNATKPTKITVSPLNTTVFVNEAVTITASTNASGSHFTFTSSDPSVATVDANGKVTGKKYGSATINVKCKENTSLTRACMIKVRNKTSVTPTGTASNASKPTKVTVSPLNQTVYIGESFIISASTNVKGSSFTFTSTDASVAKVDSNGKVSSLKAGSVTISVKCKENPSLSRACMVRVKSKPVAVITLSDESLLMGVGESYTITVKANGEKTSNASFKSTNTNVATVDKNGKITAKSKGTTKIEVTRSDGGKATCSVEVKPFAGSLTLNKSSIEMSVGDQFDFNSSAPKGTAALWRLFYSENPKVVEIRERGGLATAKSEGKTRIYCELYTGKRVYATVTVVNRPTSVKFNRTTATVSAGRDLTLKASYNITAARSDKWKSSNEKVIKFVYADASGNSTWNAVSEGTATITVTSYGNLTSTCKVTVTKKVESGNDDDTSIPADEMTLRKKVCDIMNSWVGAKQGDSTHAEIIRIYNNYCTSAPIGTYDAWCAATVSAAWIKAGIAEYTGAHCNCGGLESFAMQHGIWVEDDGYKPKIGDAIIYYWGDNGVGDVTYYADHVGLVTAVNGNKFTVTEGNTGNSECATREVTVNGRYIRGFITPKYGDIVKKLNK